MKPLEAARSASIIGVSAGLQSALARYGLNESSLSALVDKTLATERERTRGPREEADPVYMEWGSSDESAEFAS